MSLTYLIYIVFWELFALGGSSYLVFGLHESGWWMLLGLFLSFSAYSPEHWKKLSGK